MRFGTDGIRGRADTEVTTELAESLGRAAATVLGPTPALVIGRDTRESGPRLEAAFAAGVASMGVDPLLLGVAPTPAVAWVSADQHIPGAVISASHNPYQDNGIKLFAAGGRKLTDDVESAIEAALHEPASPASQPGRPTPIADHVDAWAASVAGTLAGRRLDGLRIVVDCANGAASVVGPEAFDMLGATVHALHARPDGTNINASSGATHPADLRRAVVDLGADLGLALDGDADRCIAVDANGDLVDGDRILAVLALDRHERRALPGDTVVVTVMSNLGFRIAMAEHDIHVVDTAVGDRYVLDALEAGGWALGGEQSGHVIQRDLATTGDGVLTGVHLCDVVARTGRSLHDLAAVVEVRPQVLRNVALPRRLDVDVTELVADDLAAAKRRLGTGGRVLLRPSGTEPLVRVMVEAPTEQEAADVADALAAAVEAAARSLA